MKNDYIAILDYGSSKITCFVGSPSQEGFVINTIGQSKYSGYSNGEWYEPEKLAQATSFAIKQAEQNLGERIKNVFVGVAGEFVSVIAGEASLAFHTNKKVTKDDISEIFSRANIYREAKGYTAISRSSIYFLINDTLRTVDPIGKVANKLTGLVSFIFASDVFCDKVSKALSSLGVNVTEFISSNLAEALYLVEPAIRDDFAVLIDIGYISSSVMLIGGDGLVFMKSFSLGSGHIIGDLLQVLNIAFPVAEQLYSGINLNLEFTKTDMYKLKSGVEVEANKASDIVRARIEDISDYIVKCFVECEFEIPATTPVYLTGGGLTYVKGAHEYLGKQLNKNIKIITSANSLTNRHEFTSSYGLLDLAIKQQKPKKKGLFAKLFS
ncbi:MAG: hypothetical protein RR248_02905 [Clostridia bacterium]